jgi:hypothetical protein
LSHEPYTRACGLCGTRQPLADLGLGTTSWQCLDLEACEQRARSAGLLPVAESELSVAQREALAGAVPQKG